MHQFSKPEVILNWTSLRKYSLDIFVSVHDGIGKNSAVPPWDFRRAENSYVSDDVVRVTNIVRILFGEELLRESVSFFACFSSSTSRV